MSSLRDDDDINDVAAMGGVNLVEEHQRILANEEFVGAQIRSCKDDPFLSVHSLQERLKRISLSHGLEDVSMDVVALVSHAAEERLKTFVEKLGIIAEHRIENLKVSQTTDLNGRPTLTLSNPLSLPANRWTTGTKSHRTCGLKSSSWTSWTSWRRNGISNRSARS